MAKKKTKDVPYELPPLKTYRSVNNRYLVIDWASLSYHKMFSLNTAKNREKYGFVGAEGEVKLWRSFMIDELMKLIALFNPMHIIIALEGPGSWRKKFVKDYYAKNATVYYVNDPDNKAYFVRSDNTGYEVRKAQDDSFMVTPIKIDDFPKLESLKHKLLGELPQKKQDMLWKVYAPNGKDPILPSYKGTRNSNDWPFTIDRKIWRKYKEQFAQELAPIFRARAIFCEGAEGDDVVYASAKKFSGVADDVIVVTHDSDMLQINFPKVKIYDHISCNFITVDDPVKYLDIKVLAGDTSDNIHGMAFVKPKTGKQDFTVKNRFGEGTAAKFIEAFPNVYDVAKNNGWGEQYMRNRKLIDLSCTPVEVTTRLNEMLDRPEPDLCGFELLDFWDVEPYYKDLMQNMRSYGYRSMIPVSMAEKKAPVAMPEVPPQNLDSASFMPIPPGGQPARRPGINGFTVKDTDGLVEVGSLL